MKWSEIKRRKGVPEDQIRTDDRNAYRVTAEPDGCYWLLRVPAIGKVTQATSLEIAEFMARELIAIFTDQPTDSFDVVIEQAPKPPSATLDILTLAQAAEASASRRRRYATRSALAASRRR